MSAPAALKHLKIAPKEAHKATIIFCHVRVGLPPHLKQIVMMKDDG